MEQRRSLYNKSFDEFKISNNLMEMIEFCIKTEKEASKVLSSSFFKNLVNSMIEYFSVCIKNDYSIEKISENLIPMFKVFQDSYKINFSILDNSFLEKLKEFLIKILSKPLNENSQKTLYFLIIIIQLFDIIVEYKIITGCDDKLLQYIYNLYQSILFCTFSNTRLESLFSIPFLQEAKFLLKFKGEKGEITDLALCVLENLKKVVEKTKL